eukprot:4309462-Prymnesium_polylepis.1
MPVRGERCARRLGTTHPVERGHREGDVAGGPAGSGGIAGGAVELEMVSPADVSGVRDGSPL